MILSSFKTTFLEIKDLVFNVISLQVDYYFKLQYAFLISYFLAKYY